MRPNFSYFNDKDSAMVLTDEDFKNAKVQLPAVEHLSYENERKRGMDGGFEDGYEVAQEEYEITYPCSVGEKPITMKSGSKSHKALIGYINEHGGEQKCGELMVTNHHSSNTLEKHHQAHTHKVVIFKYLLRDLIIITPILVIRYRQGFVFFLYNFPTSHLHYCFIDNADFETFFIELFEVSISSNPIRPIQDVQNTHNL
jgi:hypothetical protein